MKYVIALCIFFSVFTPLRAQTTAPHYDIHASFDPDGKLNADVAITLNEAVSDKSFLLSRRFELKSMALPRGVSITMQSTETPVKELTKLNLRFAQDVDWPATVRLRYSGPINTPHDSGVPAFRDEGYELFIDHMWFPVAADIQTRFTADAWIEGLADDMVVVAQGEVTRSEKGVRIQRDFIDIDLPIVAMRGLKRAEAYGVEFYARDLSTRLSQFYVKHAEGAARYFEKWLGPLPQPVRIAQVPRKSSLGYARTGYTVVSEKRGSTSDVPETNPAHHVAHEIAHAWWMLASPLTDDFWLVESTAQYMALRYSEEAFGPEQSQKELSELRTASSDAGPVMAGGRPSRMQLYAKAPVLLADLEKRIGRPKMDELMAEMSREPVHTMGVFLKLLTKIADAAAARDFNDALHAK